MARVLLEGARNFLYELGGGEFGGGCGRRGYIFLKGSRVQLGIDYPRDLGKDE